MKILIAGYYGFQNLGDEVILDAMLGELSELVAPRNVIITSGEPALSRVQHGVKAIHWRDIPALVAAVRSSSLVILGGGGLFHDLWGFPGGTVLTPDHWGIPFFAGPAVLAALYQKPLVVSAVGVEEISDLGAQEMTRAIFDLSWGTTVRDEVSADFLRQLGVAGDRFRVTADAAWRAGGSSERATVERYPKPHGREHGRLGVILRSWSVRGDSLSWLKEVLVALRTFVDASGARIVLIPFQTLTDEDGYDDRQLCQWVAKHLGRPDGIEIMKSPADAVEAMTTFAGCDLVLGMRYHSILLAARAGTPAVALAYAPKVRGLMDQLGMSELCQPVEFVDRDGLGRLLCASWENREVFRERLGIRTELLAVRAEQNVETIRAALSGELVPPASSPSAQKLLAESLGSAVMEAAMRTGEVLGLVTERNALLERRTVLEQARAELHNKYEILKTSHSRLEDEHRQLEDEHHRLEDEHHRLEDEHHRLEDEHRRLEDEHRRLEDEHRVLVHGHRELEAAHEQLERVHQEIVSSRLFRLLSGIWRLQNWIGKARHRPWRFFHRHVATATGDKMGRWRVFAFKRFREDMERIFQRIGSRVIPRKPIRRVSVAVIFEDEAQDLGSTLQGLAGQRDVQIEVLVAVPSGARELMEEAGRLTSSSDLQAELVPCRWQSVPAIVWETLSRSSGDMVLWLRAGDLVLPGGLGRMVEAIAARESYDGICVARTWDAPASEGCRSGTGATSGVEADLASFNLAPGSVDAPWVLMLRHGALELVGPAGELVGSLGDADLLMRLNEVLELAELRGGPGFVLGAGDRPGDSDDAVRDLEVFDDFRRNLLRGPILWGISGERSDDLALTSHLVGLAREAGDHVQGERQEIKGMTPHLWMPSARVHVDASTEDERNRDGQRGYLVIEEAVGLNEDGWSVEIAVRSSSGPEGTVAPYSWHLRTLVDVFRMIRLLAILRHLTVFERVAAAWEPGKAPLDASVILCTHRPIPPLEAAVESLAVQDMDPGRFEIIIVNNDPTNEELRRRLEKIAARHFRDGAVTLRIIPCPVPGLSHARNAGIAAARGEIVLFLDDDAVAPSSWVATAVSLFAAHREYGVIGGYIRLVPPKPKPKVIQPGWERYWSQYLGDEDGLHEVTEWWDYPWGASWCARRSVLLQIGGFRVGYGRTKGDFAGGEEVVAASLAAKLGWKVGVASELEVEHRVIEERFTWKHVRKTILAGTMGNYRMQRDLYIPMDGIDWTVHCLLSPSVDKTVGANSILARLRHWSYRKRSWARLLLWQLRDARRLRRLADEVEGCKQ